MIGQQFGHYLILQRLGAGGMGEVYLARDTQLDRKVAIKFLLSGSPKRLVREARAAAGLNHPNICAIYQVVEDEDRSFIVMQYVEGETLAARIARQPLAAETVWNIALQVAAALAEAHAHRIIHRDIKPQNIMLTPDGRATVLDFGLAGSITDATAGEAETRNSLTADGAIAGTIPYMSPEQLRGEPLDARTDIFSLGAVLYEMLTGRQPFAAASRAEAISAVLTRELLSPRQLVPETPEALASIVTRSLSKNRDERYSSAKDLLGDMKYRGLKPAAASPSGRRRNLAVAAIAVILLAAIAVSAYFLFANRGPAIESLAVLPFTNVSGDADTEYLSDGISDSLINNLSQASSLRVISLSSVLRFKDQQSDPQEIANELKVQAILTGRLVQRGDTLSISAELVDARDNRRIWGSQYDRKLADILQLQAEISQEISQQLRLKLSSSEAPRLAGTYTRNTEAYQMYLRGHYVWSKFTVDGARKSIEFYKQAIEKDPAYALAYSGLADSYIVLGLGAASPNEVFPKAKAAALKALELDESLAAAHISLGAYKLFYEWDWAGAERETKRAKELNPSYGKAIELNTNYGTSNHYYCQYLDVMGRSDEAIREMTRALEFDPLAFVLYGEMGTSYYIQRQYGKAVESAQKALQSDANQPVALQALGNSYAQLGRNDEAIAALKKAADISNGDPWIEGDLGNVYAVAGKENEARKILLELQNRGAHEYVSSYFMALIYTGLGEKSHALDWLEKAYEEKSSLMTWLKVEPKLDSLRSEPRFKDLQRRIGFAP